ncbi:MAG: PepSY domain-containing protein [Bacillota bacterium]
MKKRLLVSLFLMCMIILTACSEKTPASKENSLDLVLKPKQLKITYDDAVQTVMDSEEIKKITGQGRNVSITESLEPTGEDPFWYIHIKEENTSYQYVYLIDAETGEIVDRMIENEDHEDIEALKKEMTETVNWVFEQWQSFRYDDYDPTRWGLAFALNFRLVYLFDNFEENSQYVIEKQITSDVKVSEIKDAGMVYNEEDDTIYGQVRIIASYHQTIDGKTYDEPVEVMIFCKRHLDGDEGWLITNVDMVETENSKDFQKLFFGFKKEN